MPLKIVNENRRYSKSKSKTRVALAPKQISNVRAIVKKEINKQEETKIWFATVVSTSLSSNLLYTLSPLQGLSQGTNPNQRVGNEIKLNNITLNFIMQSPSGNAVTNVRILGLWHDKEISGGFNFSGVGLADSDIFLSTNNVYNSPPNLKNGQTILFDRKYTLNSLFPTVYTATQSTAYNKVQRTAKIVIPFKGKKLVWQTGTNYLANRQLYIVVIPNSPDLGVIHGVTTAAIMDISSIVSYKDA